MQGNLDAVHRIVAEEAWQESAGNGIDRLLNTITVEVERFSPLLIGILDRPPGIE